MRVLTIAASKGGVGKTTITMGMAVEAASDHKIALVDLDPQRSLEGWFEVREDRSNMTLIKDVDDLPLLVDSLEGQGDFDWLMIDTPPSQMDIIEEAIRAASFVLVPVRPGALDLPAVVPVIEMCQQNITRYAFVINGAPGAKSAVVRGATQVLRDNSTAEILKPTIINRTSYMAAPALGKTAPEIETRGSRGKSKEEMTILWNCVQKHGEEAVL